MLKTVRDILLFLTGGEQIEDAYKKIKLESDNLLIQLPTIAGPLTYYRLYSSFPPQQQQRIFDRALPPLIP